MSSTYSQLYYLWREEAEPDQYQKMLKEAHAANMFSFDEWRQALFDYLSLSMDDILKSENPLIRALGMVDRRLGRRRLKTMDVSQEHQLVQRLYRLRCDAEGVAPPAALSEQVSLTSKLQRPTWHGRGHVSEQQRKGAIDKLAKGKKTRDITRLVTALCRGSLSGEDLDTELSRKLSEACAQASDPLRLLDILKFLRGKSKLLASAKYLDGIVALTHDPRSWLRPVETWRPRTHNPDRQFSSLARHLFAQFDVPAFMDRAWLRGSALQQEWFKHIGQGGNIRTAPDLPVPLTKKMAHHFLGAPVHYSFEEAFLWGQVCALGGDGRLVEALRETRLTPDFHDNEFRLSVLRFLVANPMLDPVHLVPLIDYIWHEKYEDRVVFVDRGVAQEAGPAQPNFSMRGRTVVSLLRQVETWHRQLGRELKTGGAAWKHSPLRDWQFVEGTKEARNMQIWRIRELLSAQELIAEGRQQHHCVATYAQSCAAGRCSIWTMDVETESGREKCVTIEVGHADKVIRQVRGKRNRFPTEKEKEILLRWATQEGLEMASYLR